MVDIQTVWNLLKGRTEIEMARISAYVLAPGLLVALSVSGVFGGGSGLDLERAFAISELKTEIVGAEGPTTKSGIILIAEPMDSEYRIQLGSAAPRVWSSLNEEQARANKGHLSLDSSGLNSKTPFIGVNEPVTIVLEGEVGKHVHVPGSTQALSDWRLSPRRSSSVVSSVLFACVFAFGISIASGIPSSNGDKETTSQVSA